MESFAAEAGNRKPKNEEGDRGRGEDLTDFTAVVAACLEKERQGEGNTAQVRRIDQSAREKLAARRSGRQPGTVIGANQTEQGGNAHRGVRRLAKPDSHAIAHDRHFGLRPRPCPRRAILQDIAGNGWV